jgi:hypothetical protein
MSAVGRAGQETSSNLFIKVTINQLMFPKDGTKQPEDHIKSCETAICIWDLTSDYLEKGERNLEFYEAVFRPFMFACGGKHIPSILIALDCLSKLFGYKFWGLAIRKSGQDSEGLIALIVETIASCFVGEYTDEQIQLQVIKVRFFKQRP